jgi:hypothetical protein
MANYSIHIGGLSSEENEKINAAVNSGQEVRIEAEAELPEEGDRVTRTAIHQTVHQCGENNYTFDKPVSGLHIGEIIK